MTPTVMTSNSVVVGEDGATGVVLVDLDHGGSEFHVVDLEAGHTHWDTGIRLGLVCMVVAAVSVLRRRVCISAKWMEANRITRLYLTIHMLMLYFVSRIKEYRFKITNVFASLLLFFSFVFHVLRLSSRSTFSFTKLHQASWGH